MNLGGSSWGPRRYLWSGSASEEIGQVPVDPAEAGAGTPIDHVDLAVDGIGPVTITTPTLIGSPSAALTADAVYLVVAMGHSATTNGSSHLNLVIGGIVCATETNHQGFGANDDQAPGLSGTSQLACAFAFTATAGDTMEFQGWCDDVDFYSTSNRAYALDLSNITDGDGRWHEQTANSDTVVTTPVSGFTDVGTPLTFTCPRTGDYVIIASCEAVHDPAGGGGDYYNARLVQDGVAISGTTVLQQSDSLLNQVHGYFAARTVSLQAGVSYTFAIQGNGTVANGFYGFRRIRLHAIEAAQIEDTDVQFDTDTDGLTITGTGSARPSMVVTLDPPITRDYLLLTDFQSQMTWWARGQFEVTGAADEPTDGFINSVTTANLGATGDMVHTFGVHITPDVSTSVLANIFLETGPGATGGGGAAEFGADCVRAGAGAMGIVAIRLASVSGGAADVTGDFDASLPVPTMAAAGDVAHEGVFATSLPVPVLDAPGAVEHAGVFASSLPPPTMSAAGAVEHDGTFTGSLPLPVLDAAGTVENAGVFAATLPVPTMSAAGQREETGSFAATLPVPAFDAAGAVEHEGIFATSLPLPVLDATGAVEHEGTFTGSLPVPILDATGQAEREGTFAASLLVPTLAASGEVTPLGVFAATLLVPTMAAAGAAEHQGTFAGSLLVPTMAASGQRGVDGIFAGQLPVPALDAEGGSGIRGELTLRLPAPGFSAFGIVTPGAPPVPPVPPTPPHRPSGGGGGGGFPFPFPWPPTITPYGEGDDDAEAEQFAELVMDEGVADDEQQGEEQDDDIAFLIASELAAQISADPLARLAARLGYTLRPRRKR